MPETLISEICKIRQENKIISCYTENKETLCPKEYRRGIFRKECIGKKRKNQEEQKIVNYFKNNNGMKLEELESGLVLYEECKRNVGKFAEETLYLTKEKIDIPCFNKNDNDIVIVEVKSETAGYITFGQILHYFTRAENITCANTELGKSNVNKVRGIILAKKIDSSLKELVKKYKNTTPNIDLKEYDWGAAKNLITKDVL